MCWAMTTFSETSNNESRGRLIVKTMRVPGNVVAGEAGQRHNSEVELELPDGRKVAAGSVHTIPGPLKLQGDIHTIPGSAAAGIRFKQLCLSSGLRVLAHRCCPAPPADGGATASLGGGRPVLFNGGDMNLVGDIFTWGIQTNLVDLRKSPTGELGCVSADPAKLAHSPTMHASDWVVPNARLAEVVLDPPDKAHAAVIARWAAPACQRALPLPPSRPVPTAQTWQEERAGRLKVLQRVSDLQALPLAAGGAWPPDADGDCSRGGG